MNGTDIRSTALTQRTDLLVDRVDQATDTILSRFQSIVDLSTAEDAERNERSDSAFVAATRSVQIEHSASQIVRAVQDLRIILREVREHWVLGAKVGRPQEAAGEQMKDDHSINEKIQQAVSYLGRIQNAAELTNPSKGEMP